MSLCPAGQTYAAPLEFLHPSRRPNMIVVVSLLPEQELDLVRGDPPNVTHVNIRHKQKRK
jgi:hypothetical protein